MSKIYYKFHIYENLWNPRHIIKTKKIILRTKKQQKLQPKNYEKYEFLKMTNTREEGKV